MDKVKIIISGYPHTGTSILKSKIGECNGVYELPYEYYEIRQCDIDNSKDKKFIVVKTPVLPVEFRIDGPLEIAKNSNIKYHNYKSILTIRNPWYVFTSIIKKGLDPLAKLDNSNWQKLEYFITINEYFAAAEKFLEARNNKEICKNIFTIKYEEFFENNYANLKILFDKIGLEYNNEIFDSRTKDYIHFPNVKYSDFTEEPKEYDKWGKYRTWQINQPFQNMNSEVDIPEELNKMLSESPIIKELGYTDPRIK